MSEILGTLFKYLVALLGVAAVVAVLYNVFGSNKTQNALSDLTLLQSNTQALYNAQTSFATLNNTVAINGKLAPPSMTASGAMLNQWGGAVTINANGGNQSEFDITEAAVPQDSCAKMITGTTNGVGLKVNGATQTLPMDAGSAVTACSGATNSLTFTFAH